MLALFPPALVGQSADELVGMVGDELLSGALPGGAAAGVAGETMNAVVQGIEEDDFKGALLGGAKRVGLETATDALEAATGVQIGAVVSALRDADNFGQAMRNLAKALPSLAGGILARATGLPGVPGAGAGGQPGPLGGPPGAPGMAGPVMDTRRRC